MSSTPDAASRPAPQPAPTGVPTSAGNTPIAAQVSSGLTIPGQAREGGTSASAPHDEGAGLPPLPAPASARGVRTTPGPDASGPGRGRARGSTPAAAAAPSRRATTRQSNLGLNGFDVQDLRRRGHMDSTQEEDRIYQQPLPPGSSFARAIGSSVISTGLLQGGADTEQRRGMGMPHQQPDFRRESQFTDAPEATWSSNAADYDGSGFSTGGWAARASEFSLGERSWGRPRDAWLPPEAGGGEFEPETVTPSRPLHQPRPPPSEPRSFRELQDTLGYCFSLRDIDAAAAHCRRHRLPVFSADKFLIREQEAFCDWAARAVDDAPAWQALPDALQSELTDIFEIDPHEAYAPVWKVAHGIFAATMHWRRPQGDPDARPLDDHTAGIILPSTRSSIPGHAMGGTVAGPAPAAVTARGAPRLPRKHTRIRGHGRGSGSSSEEVDLTGDGEDPLLMANFTELSAAERLALPVLTRPLHCLTGPMIRPYFSNEQFAAIHLAGNWTAEECDKHDRRLKRIRNSFRDGLNMSSFDVTSQYSVPPSLSLCIRFDSLGPSRDLRVASVQWGGFVRDASRFWNGTSHDLPRSMWHTVSMLAWADFERDAASNTVCVQTFRINDFQQAILQDFSSRMPAVQKEFCRIPAAVEAYQKQASDLPHFFSQIMSRASAGCTGHSLSSFQPGGWQRNALAIELFNTVWGNVLRPYFADGSTPTPRSNGPAPSILPAWSDNSAMGAAYGAPPPYAASARTVLDPPPPYEQAPRAAQSLPMRPFQPVSAHLLGSALAISHEVGMGQCRTCGTSATHRGFECPILYAQAYGEACPCFTTAWARVAAAWSADGELTEATKRRWQTYIDAHHIMVSGFAQRTHRPVDLGSAASGGRPTPPRRAGRGRGQQ